MRSFSETYSAIFPADYGSSILLNTGSSSVSFSSVNSPRVNGKLVLRTNPFHLSRQKIALAINYYSYRYVDHIDDNGNIVYGYNPNYSSVGPLQSSVSVVPQDLVDDCTRKFQRQASSLQSNIALMFAERKKTTDTILKTMAALASAGRLLKRGRFQQAARALGADASDLPGRDISKQWLALQYAWLPMLSDVASICGYKPPLSRPVKASAVLTEHSPTLFDSSPPFKWAKDRSVTYRVSMRAQLVITNSAVASASSLGLTDPLSVAWELVPFSFVADWFLPVGDYLSRLHALDGAEFVNESFTTTIHTVSSTVFFPDQDYHNVSVSDVSGGKAVGDSWIKDRFLSIPNSAPPPKLKSPFSFSHFANALALLISVFRRF